MIWSHIGPWTWCRIVRWGRRYQTGENHGTPFHTSTSPSEAPHAPRQLGRRGPWEDACSGFPGGRRRIRGGESVGRQAAAAEVRCTMSSPAAAHRRMNSSAWTSEPPASRSSRSRQASTCTRRTPRSMTSPTSRSISACATAGSATAGSGIRGHGSGGSPGPCRGRTGPGVPRGRCGSPHYDAPSDACLPASASAHLLPDPAFPPPGSIARFSDHVVAHDLPAPPGGPAGRDRRLRRAAHRPAALADAARRRRWWRSPSTALGRVVGLRRLVGLPRRPSAAGARRVRPARAVAGLRLRVGHVARHRARRRPARARDRSARAVSGEARRPTSSSWGPGAGGAPTAALLAEAGFDVLVLEEGEMVRQGDVVPFSLEQMDRQYRAGGVTAALGLPSIAYTEGCCAGGGTEVNSGLYRRPPEEVLERWRRERRLVDFEPDELFRICDEVERELSVQTVPGAQTPASEALRRGAAAARLAPRRDPALDDVPRRRRRPFRSPAEHDRDVPPPRRGRRRPAADRPPGRPPGARREPGHPSRGHAGPPGEAGTVDFRARRRVRRRHPDACPAAALRACAATSAGPWPCTPPSSWRPASTKRSTCPTTCPVHQVKEFSPDLSFGGSASSAGLVALALSDEWERFGPAIRRLGTPGRVLRGHHQRGPGPGPGRPRPARSPRHLPPHPPRSGPARAGPGPPGPAHAGGRRHRGVPLLPGRAGRAPAVRPRHAAGHLRRLQGQP